MQWLYFVIIGLVLVFRLIRMANKGNENRPRRSPNTNPNSVQSLIQDALSGRRPNSGPPPVPARRRQSRNKEVEQAESGHFSEERLIEEFRRTHERGQTIQHHTHDYFDEEKDSQKSRSLEARKKVHPIVKVLRQKGGKKNAILMAEIMKRKY